LEHLHVKAIFGGQEKCTVKIGPKNGIFSEIERSKY